jgi:RNA polymerase sigma factor (sigma-70 family)
MGSKQLEAMENRVPLEKLNEETFRKAVTEYRERIFLVLLRYTRNKDDAKDLVQEAFVKAYRSRANFRGESSVYTWLYRIAINLAINYKSRSRVSSLVSFEDTTEPVGTGDPSDGVLDQEMKSQINIAIAKLPPRQRMVFILHYYEERPHAEIASMLGITEGAVKANYHQAIIKLRVELARYLKG